MFYLLYKSIKLLLKLYKVELIEPMGADPVVDNAVKAEKLLDKMIEIQKQHLGYLI